MNREQVSRITCDFCLHSLIEDEGVMFFSYQGIDICHNCCFILQRLEMFSRDAIKIILGDYYRASRTMEFGQIEFRQIVKEKGE